MGDEDLDGNYAFTEIQYFVTNGLALERFY